MGFLTDLFQTVAPFVPGLGPIGAGVASIGAESLAARGGVIAEGVQALTGAGASAPVVTGTSGGNGATHRRTIVQSIDNSTGEVLREEISPGSPFLMSRDFQTAMRVFSLVSAAQDRQAV